MEQAHSEIRRDLLTRRLCDREAARLRRASNGKSNTLMGVNSHALLATICRTPGAESARDHEIEKKKTDAFRKSAEARWRRR